MEPQDLQLPGPRRLRETRLIQAVAGRLAKFIGSAGRVVASQLELLDNVYGGLHLQNVAAPVLPGGTGSRAGVGITDIGELFLRASAGQTNQLLVGSQLPLWASEDGVAINSKGNGATFTPQACAALQIEGGGATPGGLLLPRLTTAERDDIPAPVEGLAVWNTTTTALNVYDGATWRVATLT